MSNYYTEEAMAASDEEAPGRAMREAQRGYGYMGAGLTAPAGEVSLRPANSNYIKQASALASALGKVILDRRLFVELDGRKYVTVEAWTLLANMLGVRPVVAWSRPIKDHNDKPGWEARVDVYNVQGQLIGSGEAMCSRSEVIWGGGVTARGKNVPPREDFAIRAMAQTRAISRALRNPLGFVVKLAGYQATPAEEMGE